MNHEAELDFCKICLTKLNFVRYENSAAIWRFDKKDIAEVLLNDLPLTVRYFHLKALL